jgi:hypothetical protein
MLMYTPALPHDNGTQMQPQPRRQEFTMGPTRSESMVAESPRDVAPSGSPRLTSDSRADRLSGSATTVWSESGKEELLSLLTREHLDHASLAGLRQPAERFVDGALGLLFPRCDQLKC